MSEGNEDLKSKILLELVPPEAIIEVGKVFTYGANKYGKDNWRKGISFSKLFGATLRHLYKWFIGNDVDEESGLSHLSHALANVMMLLVYTSNDIYSKYDDRVRGGSKDLFKE